MILVLKDDGIGISKEINFTNSETLGIRLVNILVDQHGGKISVNNSKGTEYTITLENII
ncbi:MAG TPA: ATP-binding protein [Ignavibacteriaceae bacterium]|nr:ATP-binding protein [Ignavibacteriaceae bacterium]